MNRRKTAAERKAMADETARKARERESYWRTMPARPYRDTYRPAAVRWGFEPHLHKTTDEVWRMNGVSVRVSGGRDWDGSCYAVTVAVFNKTADGWSFQDTVYPTLLRAVRAYYTAEKRAERLRVIAEAARN